MVLRRRDGNAAYTLTTSDVGVAGGFDDASPFASRRGGGVVASRRRISGSAIVNSWCCQTALTVTPAQQAPDDPSRHNYSTDREPISPTDVPITRAIHSYGHPRCAVLGYPTTRVRHNGRRIAACRCHQPWTNIMWRSSG